MLSSISQLRFGTKLVLSFSIPVIALLCVTAVFFNKAERAETAKQWTAHTYEVLALLDSVIAGMVDQETGLRGYLLAGNPAFLEPYTAGASAISESLRELGQRTSDNPRAQAKVADLRVSVAAWQNDHAQRAIRLFESEATRSDGVAMETTGAGKAMMDAIRAQVGDFKAMEAGLLAQRSESFTASLDEGRYFTGLAALAGVVFSIGAGLFLAQTTAAPINNLTQQMQRLANNDLNIVVDYTQRGDEVGSIAKSVQVFRDQAVERRDLQARETEAQAARTKRLNEIEKLISGFESGVTDALTTVSSTAKDLNETADRMAHVVQTTSARSTASAAGAGEASASVQTAASAAEEMSISLTEISTQVSKAADVVAQAVSEMETANTTVGGLSASARTIGEVVELIADIADQTNLLALNATIEAARAGEAGKGFAVVASEVKNLAERTSRSTDEISTQINKMQSETDGAVVAIKTVADTVLSINSITTTISAAVEEQTSATAEIARSVAEAAAGTQDVTENIQALSKTTEASGTDAESVRAYAGDMSTEAANLNREIDQFLTGIRAA